MKQVVVRFMKLDRFTLFILVAVLVASYFPVKGKEGLATANVVTNLAIALLFFLHGARLSRAAIIGGVMHWRLHSAIFTCTFIMFPLLGLALRPLLEPMVTPELYKGILYLCVLPATVQSAIAFTSIARGNIPAAVCSASASSILGIFITPILLSYLFSSTTTAGIGSSQSLEAIKNISLQLLLPFTLGHLSRRWTAEWIGRHRSLLKFVDQGSIILVVFVAFSEAVTEGLWKQTPIFSLVSLIFISLALLAIILLATYLIGHALGFSLEDRITLVFCGSKKSLASGVPMAQILFAGQAFGATILPLMIFHQIQLMVCAFIAARLAMRKSDEKK